MKKTIAIMALGLILMSCDGCSGEAGETCVISRIEQDGDVAFLCEDGGIFMASRSSGLGLHVARKGLTPGDVVDGVLCKKSCKTHVLRNPEVTEAVAPACDHGQYEVSLSAGRVDSADPHYERLAALELQAERVARQMDRMEAMMSSSGLLAVE